MNLDNYVVIKLMITKGVAQTHNNHKNGLKELYFITRPRSFFSYILDESCRMGFGIAMEEDKFRIPKSFLLRRHADFAFFEQISRNISPMKF